MVILIVFQTFAEDADWEQDSDIFSIPAADDVLPNSKNQGLKPSEDFLLNIRRC
jgi:hypothetical protein